MANQPTDRPTDPKVQSLFRKDGSFNWFHGTWRFITVLTKFCHWTLHWATWKQSTASRHISSRFTLMLSNHIRQTSLRFSYDNFVSVSYFPMRATCSTISSFSYLITLTTLWSFSLLTSFIYPRSKYLPQYFVLKSRICFIQQPIKMHWLNSVADAKIMQFNLCWCTFYRFNENPGASNSKLWDQYLFSSCVIVISHVIEPVTYSRGALVQNPATCTDKVESETRSSRHAMNWHRVQTHFIPPEFGLDQSLACSEANIKLRLGLWTCPDVQNLQPGWFYRHVRKWSIRLHWNNVRITRCLRYYYSIRGCIQNFPDWLDNEINNNKYSLRSNTKGYGGKTH